MTTLLSGLIMIAGIYMVFAITRDLFETLENGREIKAHLDVFRNGEL